MPQKWYALRVRSNFEHTTGAFLTSSGHEVFLPTYRDQRRWSDRTKEVDVPLFRGYIFCHMDVNKRQDVIRAPGLVSIVSFGNAYVPVPDTEIEAVRTIVDSPVFRTPWPYLAVGERVVVDRGPLAGIEGILLDYKNGGRLIVSVHLLQRSIAAEIATEWVRPLKHDFQLCFDAALASIESRSILQVPHSIKHAGQSAAKGLV